jgi:hypothetical protein
MSNCCFLSRGTRPSLNNNDVGRAVYYSAYIRAQRRLAKGLTLLASCTRSRNETDVLGVSTARITRQGRSAEPSTGGYRFVNVTAGKREPRNVFRPRQGYSMSCAELAPLPAHSGADIFEGVLPWDK